MANYDTGDDTVIEEIKTKLNRVANVMNTERVYDGRITIDFRLDVPNIREVSSSLVTDEFGELRMLEVRFPPFDALTKQEEQQEKLDEILSEANAPDDMFSFVRPKTGHPHARYEKANSARNLSTDSAIDLVERLTERWNNRWSDGPEEQDGINLEQFVRRLERVGAVDPVLHDKLDFEVVDWRIGEDDKDKVFSSSAEFSDGVMKFVEFRLPHMTVDPTPQQVEEYGSERDARRKLVIDLWDRVAGDIAQIIEEETDIQVIGAVPQRDDVVVRPQDGFLSTSDGQNLTPHIQFDTFGGPVEDMSAPISVDEVVRLTKRLVDMWQEEYFNVKTLKRADLESHI
jgi:hypothetical protein